MEITAAPGLNILEALARNMGVDLVKGKVTIPEGYGSGYLQGFMFGDSMRMMIRNYALNEDIFVRRSNQSHPENMILFHFRNIFEATDTKNTGINIKQLPSVQITTQGLNADLFIPRFTYESSIIIVANAAYLNSLLDPPVEAPVLKSILKNAQPLIFEQLIFPSLRKVVDEIMNAKIPEAFLNFFYRLKAEELLCTLLMELVQREEASTYPLNTADIIALYQVKDLLLERLDKPQSVEALAKLANMSESKLKRLFKQVFGKSIFNYFQSFRMQEAARLLKEERLSVSETGYKLGFSNLSHFGRIFEEYMGVKPKKYSRL